MKPDATAPAEQPAKQRRVNAIISEALAQHRRSSPSRRHPADVTADRLGDAVTRWHDRFGLAERPPRQVVGDANPVVTATSVGSYRTEGQRMNGVTIYCYPCRTNHRLGQRDAEDTIQALIAELATEQAEGNVFTNPVETDTGDDRVYGFCVLEELHHYWRSGEVLAEHLEGMRDARLAHAAAASGQEVEHG